VEAKPEAEVRRVLLHDGGKLLSAEVETVYPRDRSSLASSLSIVKSATPPAWKPNRKRKCVELCKRVAAFLLSTVGLTMLTIAYAVAGGYLFSALESGNEVTVKSGVTDALQWHIDIQSYSQSGANVQACLIQWHIATETIQSYSQGGASVHFCLIQWHIAAETIQSFSQGGASVHACLIQWHIDALWNSTAQLNILHPVYTTLLTAVMLIKSYSSNDR